MEKARSRNPRKTAAYRDDRSGTSGILSAFLYPRQDRKRIAGISLSVNKMPWLRPIFHDVEKNRDAKKKMAARLFFGDLEDGLLEPRVECDTAGFGLIDVL